MKFVKGQRVRFIRDSTDGGPEYGAEGDTATILEWFRPPNSVLIKLDKKCFYHSANVVDLAPWVPEDTFEKDGLE